MCKSPLIRRDGNWIENLNDSVDLGDYWFRELDIKFALELFIEESNLDKLQIIKLRGAFPEINLET